MAAPIRARSRPARKIGADAGFDEINLNAGCPSDRVQDGRFGACLMAEPALVGDCVAAMKAAVAIPVTVKCRIGIDEQDPEAALETFAEAVEHARRRCADRARAQGLAQRSVAEGEPRGAAARLCARLSAQGGASAAHRRAQRRRCAASKQALAHLDRVDGVMMGRAAYQEPWRLLAVDPLLFGEAAPFASAKAAAAALVPYIERELAQGTRLHAITRHLHGLFRAVPGARAFRRHLAGAAARPQAGAELLAAALALVSDSVAGQWTRELAHIAA